MRRELAITQEAFEALLTWLDQNREVAGRKYETIRAGLVKIFISKGFNDAEDLADQVINRVIHRLPEIRIDYIGDPANYFRGVARNIAHEAHRRKEIATDVFPIRSSQMTYTSDEYECLLQCLKLLPTEKRELILDYYLYEGHEKIEHHKKTAQELGITEGALRTRAHHVRAKIERCVLQCTKNLMEKQKAPVRPLLTGQ